MLDTNLVYRLCNQNRWFTCGTNEQYSKMFGLVNSGATIHDVALAIWLCSDGYTLSAIESTLRKESRKNCR